MKKIIVAILFISLNIYASEETNLDKNILLDMYKASCNNGKAKDCFTVGGVYRTGSGAEKNMHKAKHYFKKACDFGSTDGCFDLAVMYDLGDNVNQDDTKAKHYYKLSCDNRDVRACMNLGANYEKNQEYIQAKACDAGGANGCRGYEMIQE